jgi:hypothetical protein
MSDLKALLDELAVRYAWAKGSEMGADLHGLLDQTRALLTDKERLARFTGAVLDEHRMSMGEVGGDTVQNWALETGILETRTMTERCGEVCSCAEVTDFPIACHFVSALGQACLNAARSFGESPLSPEAP